MICDVLLHSLKGTYGVCITSIKSVYEGFANNSKLC